MGDNLDAVEITPQMWHDFSLHQTPDVVGGQIWRLEWLELAALVVIDTRRDGDYLTALPLSEDQQFATDSDLILEPGETPLRMPLMVQVPLETVVHRRVLDRCLGGLEGQAWDDLRRLRNAFVHSLPSGLRIGRVGPPITHELDERVAYRVEQRELHARFAFAEWYEQPKSVLRTADVIGRYLKETPSSIAELASASSITIPTLARLLRGEVVALTEQQLQALSLLLRMDEDTLIDGLSERLPTELVEAIDSPTVRPNISRWSILWESDEIHTRRKMARELVGGKHRAKRMSVTEWQQLLQERFPRG